MRKGTLMNHQPYESWILDETTLSLAEQRQMKDHLDSCAACRKLATGWIAARRSMRAAPPARPAPGFTGRFQARLAERRALQHQLQARRFVLITTTASMLALFALMAYLAFTTSFATLLVNALGLATRLVIQWNNAQQVIMSLWHALPIYIPVAIWVILSTGLGLLGLIWAVSLWRISAKGVTNQ